jgi:hypothetical protein
MGTLLAIHYFSAKKYRLLPLGFLFFILYEYTSVTSILILIAVSFCYLLVSIHYPLDSYQYTTRKKRKKEKSQLWLSNRTQAVFYKEVVILWRDRVFFSILFSASFLGAASGYLARFGPGNLLPESLELFVNMIRPETYAFFGIYILTIHGAVFPSLNFFLNEDDTLWLYRHLPVPMNTIIHGKALALIISFLSCIPFIAFYVAFTTFDSLVFLLWFQLFAFLVSIIICFPLGSRYLGKKSDILLLYSVSLIIFMIISISFSLQYLIEPFGISTSVWYLISIGGSIMLLLFVSLKLTARSLTIS